MQIIQTIANAKSMLFVYQNTECDIQYLKNVFEKSADSIMYETEET